MADTPSTFYGVAWDPVRDAILADVLVQKGRPPTEVAMRRLFAWEPVDGRPEQIREPSRDLLRLYYHLLRENERLPEDDQLTLEDIGLVRQTLLATMKTRREVQQMVDQLFRLVQRKVETAHVSQAWLMLQMFDYDRSVRLWNERNLYLEEMTLRFAEVGGSPRVARAPDLSDAATAVREDPAKALHALTGLAEATGLDLLLFSLDVDERAEWKEIWDAAGRGNGEPPGREDALAEAQFRKWRPATLVATGDVGELIRGTLSPEALRHHLLAHVKALYFLMLVSNPTGFEKSVTGLFGWLFERTEGGTATLFSELHRRVTMEEASVREALDALYTEKLEPVFARILAHAGDGLVQDALAALLRSLSGEDMGRVPAGRYSLTALLLDRVLGVDYAQPEAAWHIHRLL